MYCQQPPQELLLYSDFVEELDPALSKFDKALETYMRALADMCEAAPKLAEATANLLYRETQNVNQLASPVCALTEKILAVYATHFNQLKAAAERIVLNNNAFKELKQSLKNYKLALGKQRKAKTGPEMTDATGSLTLCGHEVVTRAGAFEEQRFRAWQEYNMVAGYMYLETGALYCSMAPELSRAAYKRCQKGEILAKLNGIRVKDGESAAGILGEQPGPQPYIQRDYEVIGSGDVYKIYKQVWIE